ncbi:hypothetical protein LMG27177_06870 [Paraburkholderia fynbosensis]|uniref:Uncharacterized protein n=2 Tax=Paraburkholderia fynbosensis TaxID=1200993 RepID=A0A6J5GZ45_9BURK|nr:hypothetical protein LMG27177_06870 [Paraburkholderia fynbosensis]
MDVQIAMALNNIIAGNIIADRAGSAIGKGFGVSHHFHACRSMMGAVQGGPMTPGSPAKLRTKELKL